MEQQAALRSISWEAPEHHHVEKGNDWFFALAIIVVALVIVAVMLNDVLLALFLGIAGGVLAMAAAKRPSIVPFSVSVRGIKIEDQLHAYSTLESYYIDEDDPRGPQLLIKSKRKIMPLIVIPIPPDHIDDIENILEDRLEEEHMEESLFHKIFELFGY
jgi:hypothetical protein